MPVTSRQFYVLLPTYRVIRGVPVVHLYGVTDRGESVLAVDDRMKPYFFVPAADMAAAREIAAAPVAHLEPDLLDLDANPVARIAVKDPRDVPKIRDAIQTAGIPCFEADVRFAYRYMIDNGIRGTAEIRGSAEPGRFTDLVFRRPEFVPGRFVPDLSVLSIDIETGKRAERVFSIALAQGDRETVLIHSRRPVEGAEAFPDEASMLAAFLDRVREWDPDVITGWNVVDFDLTVLDRRGKELSVPMRLGRSDETMTIQNDPAYTRQGRASIAGRQVLDGIGVVRDTGLKVENFRLQTVASEVLGRGKLASGSDRVEHILQAFVDDPEWLVKYNLEDARLVLELLDKTRALTLAVERSLLTGMPLDRVGASVATFDFLYLGELRGAGRVAPTVKENAVRGYVVGGTVLDSQAGIFPWVAVLDFKSLYPSIIRTFGIDPLAFDGAGDQGEVHLRSPNGALFRRGEGILPRVMDGLWERRDRAKREGDEATSTAVKLLMNSFYGVLGTPSCRFAESAVANAITSFGAEILSRTKAEIEEGGLTVLYGDTDSVFVHTDARDLAGARAVAESIRERVNGSMAQWAMDTHGVESKLELEVERIYRQLFLPHVRGGSEGSKKRYAGLAETAAGPELHVVGMEAVRRDWPEAGRRFQRELLRRVFERQEVDDYVREYVRLLRTGQLDHELVYRKVLRKNPDEYVRSEPPHVRAARLGGKKRGSVVRYVATRDGPMPVPPDGPLPQKIDHDHYVEKVIRPIADAILTFLGRRFDEVSGDDPQLTLF